VRVFVTHSDERLDYERGEREKAMQKVQEQLEALKQRMDKGKLKAPGSSIWRLAGCSPATMDSDTTLGNCKTARSTILNTP
jgi:aryl-alcohol dehydrogenase-like predicted oxidoreductase